MTFNVPAGTEAGVAVVREDATPGELAMAGQDLLDQAMGKVLEAMGEVDLPEDVCSLAVVGNEVSLLIDDPEVNRDGYYRGLVERQAGILAKLGIGRIDVRASLEWSIVRPGLPR